MPLGHAPRLPELLLVPVRRPTFPGLIFDFPLSALPPSTRTALQAQADKRIPFVGLFLHRKDHGDGKTVTGLPGGVLEVKAEKGEKGEGEEAGAEGAGGEGAAMAELQSVSDVYSVGVLVQFELAGDRVRGHVHRRLRLRGPVEGKTQPLYVQVEYMEEPEQRRRSSSTKDSSVNVNADDAMEADKQGQGEKSQQQGQAAASSASPSSSLDMGQMDRSEYEACVKEMQATVSELTQTTDIQRRMAAVQSRIISTSIDSMPPSRLADLYACFTAATAVQLQEILEAEDVSERFTKTLVLLKREQEEARVQLQIMTRMQEKVQQQQNRHLLREQKRIIDEMLGNKKGDREQLRRRYEDRLQGKTVPPEVRAVIDEELTKLQSAEPDGQEFNVLKSYLDWLTVLPWGLQTADQYDIAAAERILQRDHFGLDDVKQRILEIIATGRLLGHIPNTKTLCLVGPPGTGKCFAAGTMLRLYDGSCVAVEKITGGELLMGDDSTPRIVTPGTVTRGRAAMYRIEPQGGGHTAFTVNGDHILVLSNSERPQKRHVEGGVWEVSWYEVDTTNEMRLCAQSFADSAAADAELAAQLQLWCGCLEWEVSVDDFLSSSLPVQQACRLIHSAAVSFQSPLYRGLEQRLSELTGQRPSDDQLDWAAWYLGFASAEPSTAVSGHAADGSTRSGATARLAAYWSLFQQRDNSLAHQLLQSYQQPGSETRSSLPSAWLLESLRIRRHILAGALDGCSEQDAGTGSSTGCLLAAAQRQQVEAYAELAASVGVTTSGIVEPSQPADGSLSLQLTGGDLQPVVVRCAQAGRAALAKSFTVSSDTAARSFPFSILPQPVDAYYGFAVSGSNRRFLLSDFTVTHNTSVGQSIARALGRRFHRFSVGGMDDVAEIKGHRRTYVGAMPGKLVQQLKLSECVNPVIMLDEVDKMGRGGWRGDPAAALLEVLDPEQNSAYTDHYLDVPVDLSKVLFICTANAAEFIPPALADRMEFIHLSGYIAEEKVQIASRYLQPLLRRKNGVSEQEMQLGEETLLHLIRWYAREAGVRNLSKQLDKVYRKVAMKLERDSARSLSLPIVVTPENLHEYVGKKQYSGDRMYEQTPVGVAMGLAWTQQGGSCIFIESAVANHAPVQAKKERPRRRKDKQDKQDDGGVSIASIDSGGEEVPVAGGPLSLFTTGQLGDVMRESSVIAFTVAKRLLSQLAPQSSFFYSHQLHLHVPSGSTPKDGPSAGISMCAALLSLALNTPLRQGVALTGELTVTGRVTAIGGVKEKVLAAKQALVTRVVLPKDNSRDWQDMEAYMKDGIEAVFVERIEQVVDAVLPDWKDKAAKEGNKLQQVVDVPPPEPVKEDRAGATQQ